MPERTSLTLSRPLATTNRPLYSVVGISSRPPPSPPALVQSRAARAWTSSGSEVEGRLQIPTSDYSGLFVSAEDREKVNEVRREITELGYSTSAPENLVASVQRYLRVVEIVLGAIGAIALVIASLGIANALLAAVR